MVRVITVRTLRTSRLDVIYDREMLSPPRSLLQLNKRIAPKRK